MKLYKYINFENKYWDQPLLEDRLYFSSIYELRSRNDRDEFNYSWDYNSYFFKKFSQPLKESYDRLFSAARILCLSQNLSKKCWDEFCPNGGVCYEFSDGNTSKVGDLTSSRVIYLDEKNYNAPDFIVKSVSNPRIRFLLSKKEEAITTPELAELANWLEGPEPLYITYKHIVDELSFKKNRNFEYEREYRFIHPETPSGSKVTPLIDAKLTFSELGLTLRRVFTSDIGFIKDLDYSNNLKISKPSFVV